MKRSFAVFLTVIMLFVSLMPAQAFAETGKSLEEVLKSVKSKIDIPEDFTFNKNYDAYTQEDGKTIWYLTWNSKDDLKGSIWVSADDSGTIYSYDRYIPYNYSDRKKLPKVSRGDALESAESFIKKVNPVAAASVKLQDSSEPLSIDYNYYFTFYRVKNGVPLYENYISVTVDRDTGIVRNYYYNWNDDLSFPSTIKAITLEQAEKAYREKAGLKLVYKYSYDYENDEIKIFPAYVPVYGSTYSIDALTGELIQTGYYGRYAEEMGTADMAMKSTAEQAAEVNLSPEELEAAQEASGLISREDAEKTAREFEMLGLTEEYKLSNARLSRSWPNKDEFLWRLSFVKEARGDNDYRYASITLNAKTGEITNFYTSIPYDANAKAKYDEKDAKAAAEEFLKEFKPELFSQTEYDTASQDDVIIYAEESEKPLQYYVNYTRMVDGIPFTDNYLNIGYDAVNGKIYSFSMAWFDVEFPAVSQNVTSDKAYEVMFDELGLELQYKLCYEMQDSEKAYVPDYNNVKVKLVYALDTGKPWIFDPETGVVLDNDGEPYEEVKAVEYSDIDGHYAENEIRILAQYGIALDGDEFRPDESIKQVDFLKLLSKTLSDYYVPVSYKGTDKETETLYAYMIREGIIKEDEKDPDAVITREDGVKFIIRAMKYDKVAEIKGIYKSIFIDETEINPDLIGYVSIAQGLGIISGYGGKFNPKGELTRGQAAIIIYKYLQV